MTRWANSTMCSSKRIVRLRTDRGSCRGGFQTRPYRNGHDRAADTIVQQTWDDLPAHDCGIDLDAFIVMPNQVHGIIILAEESERRHAIPGNRARKSCAASRRSPRAASMNVPAGVASCGNVATTSASFAMRRC